ncbi:MAG: hypothetical protein ACRC5M_04795 [Anaeroplasmataceae bacterium]
MKNNAIDKYMEKHDYDATFKPYDNDCEDFVVEFNKAVRKYMDVLEEDEKIGYIQKIDILSIDDEFYKIYFRVSDFKLQRIYKNYKLSEFWPKMGTAFSKYGYNIEITFVSAMNIDDEFAFDRFYALTLKP